MENKDYLNRVYKQLNCDQLWHGELNYLIHSHQSQKFINLINIMRHLTLRHSDCSFVIFSIFYKFKICVHASAVKLFGISGSMFGISILN